MEFAVIVVLAYGKGVFTAIFNDRKNECDFLTYFCFNVKLVHVVG